MGELARRPGSTPPIAALREAFTWMSPSLIAALLAGVAGNPARSDFWR
jgi:hypothetical protein